MLIFDLDVDECKLNKGLCEFGKCENIDGSFKCNCNEGFEAINKGKRCVCKLMSTSQNVNLLTR